MPWTVETLGAMVDAELDALPASMKARLARIVELIEAFGLECVGGPHVRHLEGKLWEIRIKAEAGIARALYVTATGQRVVIVHAFVKKTQRTPKAALALARKREKEVA